MTNRNAASMGNYGAAWEAAGYCGSGNVAPLIGALAGRVAVICGNSNSVFRDLRYALGASWAIEDPVIFAVNDVGMFLPQVDHWVSLHADHLGPWKSVRWLAQHEREDTKYHSVTQRPFIDYLWEGLTPLFAISGYFAMQIAHIMGAELIVLCGCPGDISPRFFEVESRGFGYGGGSTSGDQGIREQLVKEMKRLPDFKKKVRSVSGWTEDFFGGL